MKFEYGLFLFSRITILEEQLLEAKSETKQKVDEESQKYTAALVRIFAYFLNHRYVRAKRLSGRKCSESMNDLDIFMFLVNITVHVTFHHTS